jgi:serine/threonine protein kinase
MMGAPGNTAFEPAIGLKLRLFGDEYEIQEHPNAKGLMFSAEGGKGIVYQVTDRKRKRWGLKIFFQKFRTQRMLESAESLHLVARYEGLMAAARRIVTPGEGDARTYQDLHYSVLMPWVPGRTWFDSLQRLENKKPEERSRLYELGDGRQRANQFLRVMEQLEALGAAHTDISAGNVMIDYAANSTQLLDLEDMYLPSGPEPEPKATGTPGYDHPSGIHTWRPSGDRYAAAVLSAELLLMSADEFAREAVSNGFFLGNRGQAVARGRFSEAEPFLKQVAPGFAMLFTEAWTSDTLDSCPQINRLNAALSRDLARVVSPPQKAMEATAGVGGAGATSASSTDLSPPPQVPPAPRVHFVPVDRVVLESAPVAPSLNARPPVVEPPPQPPIGQDDALHRIRWVQPGTDSATPETEASPSPRGSVGTGRSSRRNRKFLTLILILILTLLGILTLILLRFSS